MVLYIILTTLAIFLLTRKVTRLEKQVAYLSEKEFEAKIGTMFNFLTEGLDPEDDDD